MEQMICVKLYLNNDLRKANLGNFSQFVANATKTLQFDSAFSNYKSFCTSLRWVQLSTRHAH